MTDPRVGLSRGAEPEPPKCKNCGYDRSEHHVGQGWCIHGGVFEDATQYEPEIVPVAPPRGEPETPTEGDLEQKIYIALCTLRDEGMWSIREGAQHLVKLFGEDSERLDWIEQRVHGTGETLSEGAVSR